MKASGGEVRHNWAGNQEFHAGSLLAPLSIEEVQAIARSSRRLRVIGSGHSFNEVADTTGDHVTLAGLPRAMSIDVEARTATIDGGSSYGDIDARLHAAGFALANLASLAHISVAGACATGTHGAGAGLSGLASAVAALDIVRADGEIASFERGEAGFEGAVVSLGSLGIVTRLTLDLEPTFDVAQVVYERMPFERAFDSFDAIQNAAYSVSLFTDWSERSFHQVWLKQRLRPGETSDLPAEFLGARRATRPLHPVRGFPSNGCSPQGDIAGPWHERLPHFRLDMVPSTGQELQSEYLIARAEAAAGLQALDRIRSWLTPLVLATEVRAVAQDDLWLSPAYQRDSVAFHFTWRPDWAAVRAVLRDVEQALRPFEPRPHWGKLFTLRGEEVVASYVRRGEFIELAAGLDPDGKFRNGFVDRFVFADDATGGRGA